MLLKCKQIFLIRNFKLYIYYISVTILIAGINLLVEFPEASELCLGIWR